MATKSKSKSTTKSSNGVGKVNAHVDKDSSVSVRQIQNGFVVSESGTIGKGRNQQYYSKEWYSKTNPVKIGGLSNGSGGAMKFGGKK